MKVYVDELPKSCEECAFCEYFEKDAHGKGKHEVACYFHGSFGNILYGNQIGPKTCPLQSLSDYTNQVRKEVCEEIREKVKNFNKVYSYPDYTKSDAIDCILDEVEEILEQTQGKGE